MTWRSPLPPNCHSFAFYSFLATVEKGYLEKSKFLYGLKILSLIMPFETISKQRNIIHNENLWLRKGVRLCCIRISRYMPHGFTIKIVNVCCKIWKNALKFLPTFKCIFVNFLSSEYFRLQFMLFQFFIPMSSEISDLAKFLDSCHVHMHRVMFYI